MSRNGPVLSSVMLTVWFCELLLKVNGQQKPFEAHCVHLKDGAAGNYGVFQ